MAAYLLDNKKLPHFLPHEVAVHNTEDDIWISIHKRVINLTEFIADLRKDGSTELDLLLANAGKDISQWFDKNGDLRMRTSPESGVRQPYLPPGSMPHIPLRDNMYDIMERMLYINMAAGSYTFRSTYGKVDMEGTLDDNKLFAEDYGDVPVCLFMYYNRDLTRDRFKSPTERMLEEERADLAAMKELALIEQERAHERCLRQQALRSCKCNVCGYVNKESDKYFVRRYRSYDLFYSQKRDMAKAVLNEVTEKAVKQGDVVVSERERRNRERQRMEREEGCWEEICWDVQGEDAGMITPQRYPPQYYDANAMYSGEGSRVGDGAWNIFDQYTDVNADIDEMDYIENEENIDVGKSDIEETGIEKELKDGGEIIETVPEQEEQVPEQEEQVPEQEEQGQQKETVPQEEEQEEPQDVVQEEFGAVE